MKRLQQLPGAPVEVDQGVEGHRLGEPIDDAEVHPSIVDPDVTLGVAVGELGDPESENGNTVYQSQNCLSESTI